MVDRAQVLLYHLSQFQIAVIFNFVQLVHYGAGFAAITGLIAELLQVPAEEGVKQGIGQREQEDENPTVHLAHHHEAVIKFLLGIVGIDEPDDKKKDKQRVNHSIPYQAIRHPVNHLPGLRAGADFLNRLRVFQNFLDALCGGNEPCAIVTLPEIRHQLLHTDAVTDHIRQDAFEPVARLKLRAPLVHYRKDEKPVVYICLPDAPVVEQAGGKVLGVFLPDGIDDNNGHLSGAVLFQLATKGIERTSVLCIEDTIGITDVATAVVLGVGKVLNRIGGLRHRGNSQH